MNMMEAFNRTLDYLESTLDGELDELRVARLSGYPYAMFSRLFSMLTGTSLSEYLRERRLTEAALALRQSEARIIDIAIQYGYESADAFGAAFKKFHGATPTQIRQGAPLRLVGRLQLRLTLQGGLWQGSMPIISLVASALRSGKTSTANSPMMTWLA